MSKDKIYTFTGRDVGWLIYSIFIATVDFCIGCVKGTNGHDGAAWFFIVVAALVYASAAAYVYTARLRTKNIEAAASVTNHYTSNYFSKS